MIIKSIEELKNILKDKNFILYGAGFGGYLFIEYFCKKYQIFPFYVLDKKFKDKGCFLNIPSTNLDVFVKLYNYNKSPIAVITVNKKKYLKEILKNLKTYNFKILILSKKIWEIFLDQFYKNFYDVKKVQVISEKLVAKVKDTCILHIGMHKTGSTSIQISLNNYEDDHFYYSKISPDGCHNLPICVLVGSEIFQHIYFQGIETDIDKNSIKIFLEGELKKHKSQNFIISAEHILLLNIYELKRLKKFLKPYYDHILNFAYVREPFGYLSSIFQQNLKYLSIKIFYENILQLYPKYRNKFQKFFEVFGRENVILKKFDPKKFPNGCVVQDFCQTFGISIKKIYRANESLPLEMIKLIYIFKKFYSDLKIPDWYVYPFLTNFLRSLLSNYPFTPFKISKEVIKPIVEANIEDVRWMEKVLGEPLIDEETLREPEPDWVVKTEEDLLTVPDEVVDALRNYTNYKLSNTKSIPQQVAEMLYQILKENFPDI